MKRSLRNKLDKGPAYSWGLPGAERQVDLEYYLAGLASPGHGGYRARYVSPNNRAVRRIERPRSRGQALLIIALMMTVLILFVGLGVDVGNLMARRAKLQSAVDASALSAAQLLTGNINTSTVQTKAYQLLEANGVLSPTLSTRSVTINTELRQVQVSAVQRVDTFFMRIIPIWATVEVSAQATADLNSFAELNIKPYGKVGVANELMLQSWGPNSWRRGGDVYSPDYIGGLPAVVNDENANQPYGYLFRIDVPPDFEDDELVIQFFDPDTYNNRTSVPTPTPTRTPTPWGTIGGPAPATNTPNAYDPIFFWCVTPVPGTPTSIADECSGNNTDSINPALKLNGYLGSRSDWVNAWNAGRVAVWRVDEYRRPYNVSSGDLGPPGSNDYDPAWPTQTDFDLWHFNPRITSAFGDPSELSDQPGGGKVRDRFTVRYNELNTDLAWYEPWEPIKLNDPSCSGYSGDDCFERESNGSFYFYLYVSTSAGSSENDFDIRVGPKTTNYAQGYNCRSLSGWSASSPSICYSNEQFYQQSRTNTGLQDWDSGGAQVFAKRALPLNLATGAAFPMLYTQVSEKAAGQTLAIKHFDQDCSSGCATPVAHYQMQYCVNVGTTGASNLCNTGNCEPCSNLLSNNCFGNLTTGNNAYRGPNDGWYCSGCPQPEQIAIPAEGTTAYTNFFGPNGECDTSWMRLDENLSYSNDTTVWEMPYRRPRLIK